jgi:hypothetical protein
MARHAIAEILLKLALITNQNKLINGQKTKYTFFSLTISILSFIVMCDILNLYQLHL